MLLTNVAPVQSAASLIQEFAKTDSRALTQRVLHNTFFSIPSLQCLLFNTRSTGALEGCARRVPLRAAQKKHSAKEIGAGNPAVIFVRRVFEMSRHAGPICASALCIQGRLRTAKRRRSSISSIAVTRSALSLPMRTDVLGASAMNHAVFARQHVLRISIVLTGRSGE